MRPSGWHPSCPCGHVPPGDSTTLGAFFVALTVAAMVAASRDSHAQIIHTPHDHIPDFAATPTIRSAASGAWSSPATWRPARVPAPSDIVEHRSRGDLRQHERRRLGDWHRGRRRAAILDEPVDRLRVGTLLVLPNGTLEVGTRGSSGCRRRSPPKIIIRNMALNAAADPDQYGTGLLSIDGTVTMHGAVKTPTFVRTAVEPRAGHSTLTLERAGRRLAGRRPDFPARHAAGAGRPLVQSELRAADRRDGRPEHQRRRADDRRCRAAAPSITAARAMPTARRRWSAARGAAAARRQPDAQRRHPLRESGGHARPHALHAPIERRRFSTRSSRISAARAPTPLDATTNHIGRYPLHIHHLLGAGRIPRTPAISSPSWATRSTTASSGRSPCTAATTDWSSRTSCSAARS